MEIRKLEQWEHKKTRHLYETVFSEDDQSFVDYYYKWKTKDNIIFVAEDADGIHAMVHLNPFQVSVEGTIQSLHYIVAVATQEEYRHQGLMRRLLRCAEQEMREAGEEMTFLMPASEKIYLPFGYRFFANQKRGILSARQADVWQEDGSRKASGIDRHSACGETLSCICRPAKTQDFQPLAEFANRALSAQYRFFVYRDDAYYERLCAEQRCQRGEVMVIENGGRIIGTFCTAEAEPEFQQELMQKLQPEFPQVSRLVLREVILDPQNFAAAEAVVRCFAAAFGDCRVEGCPQELMLDQEEEVPLMMGKTLQESAMLLPGPPHIFLNEVV